MLLFYALLHGMFNIFFVGELYLFHFGLNCAWSELKVHSENISIIASSHDYRRHIDFIFVFGNFLLYFDGASNDYIVPVNKFALFK